MKKVFFIFSVIAMMAMIACNNSTNESTTNDSTIDTVTVDSTTVNDTTVIAQ